MKQAEETANPAQIGFCGVNCAACPDHINGICPDCRHTDWKDDPCMPVACCAERRIECCGECADFPCGDMAAFYEESESHREAYARMKAYTAARTYYAEYVSPLGTIRMESDGEALTSLSFYGQKHAPGADGEPLPELPVFKETARWLDLYFAGRDPGFTPPLRLRGTPFQEKTWALLRAIPYGKTTTYGALAKTLAAGEGRERMSAQAVGNAVGRNPVALIVPCHRVIGANGDLTGYAAGLDKKEKLLNLEQKGERI